MTFCKSSGEPERTASNMDIQISAGIKEHLVYFVTTLSTIFETFEERFDPLTNPDKGSDIQISAASIRDCTSKGF